jgi:hypothetical protein
MQRKKLSMMATASLLVAAATGCEGTASDLGTEDVSETVSALEGENGLTFNGLTFNGLVFNGLTFNGLTFNGLTFNGLTFNGISFNGMTFNGITFNGLGDPTVNQFVSYLVECALPEGDSVTYKIQGKRYRFEGDFGLAPEWKDGPCRGNCQRWMTACMLARLNKTGEHVQISMRGPHDGLRLEQGEAQEFTKREAAYYGNMFDASDKIYACYSPGTPSIPRVCGDSLNGCPMNVVGSCDRACRDDARDGSFRDCGDRANVNRANRVFDEIITVFLRE